MDVFLDSPAELKATLREGLAREEEEGELEAHEVEELTRALEVPPKRPTPASHSEPFRLKGEGGSGEGHTSVSSIMAGLRPPSCPEPVSVEKEEEDDEVSLHGGDPEADEGDASVRDRSQSSGVRPDLESHVLDLQRFCEEQFNTLFQLVQSVSGRLDRVEARLPSAVPLASPLRGTGAVSPPSARAHLRTKSGVGVPRVGGAPPDIPKDRVEGFLRHSPTYPSLAHIRNSKLTSLQASLGLAPVKLEPKVSEWTVEGLYTLLVTAHAP